MAVERRFFIATTAEEYNFVENNMTFVGGFDNGRIYHDHGSTMHDLWFLDPAELDEGEEDKLKK